MILVTGGTGLVGAHLLYDLCRQNVKVKALKRKTSDTNRVLKIFKYYTSQAEALFQKIEWCEGDLLDYDSLYAALEGVQQVYHAAAVVSFAPARRKALQRHNVAGTAHVVNACLARKVEKLAYISSVAVFNKNADQSPMDEENFEELPKNSSHYARSKFNAELEVWRGVAEGLNAVVVNPSIIIASGNWGESSTALIQSVWEGMKFYTKGSGGFVDVRDVSKMLIYLMNSDLVNERYVLSAENLPYRKLANQVADALHKARPHILANSLLLNFAWRLEAAKAWLGGTEPALTRETARSADEQSYYSSRKILATTGMKFTPINEAVRRVCKHFLADKAMNS